MILAAWDIELAGRLNGVSVSLRPGEVTAICGPNGAGKSSLLACLAGLLRPDSGDVMLDGVDLSVIPARNRARSIGFLPQTPDVVWDMNVETLVSLGRLPWQGAPLHRAHGSAAQDATAIAEAIDRMDLAALAQRRVSRLSGGERARAQLARVLAGVPHWLLADEPLANLDLAHAAGLVRSLRDQAARGDGVVLVLHDLASAMNQADRVLVLWNGRLVADGPPDEALSEEIIAQVWGVQARWLGEPGARALCVA